MEKIKFFKEIGVSATVQQVVNGFSQEVFFSGNTIIGPKRGGGITAFRLNICSTDKKVVVVQKDIGKRKGAYHSEFKGAKGVFGEKSQITIPVVRQKGKTRIFWHQKNNNRFDCWKFDDNGGVELFQVGIVTPDDGRNFLLIYRPTWKGRLFQDGNRIVGKPSDPVWGPFDNRRQILEHSMVKDRLQQIELLEWKGSDTELNPPLDPIPDGRARVDWWNPFAGAYGGQGIAKLSNGCSVWVCANDLKILPGPSGLKDLKRNDLLFYRKIVSFGKKYSFKLLKVQKI